MNSEPFVIERTFNAPAERVWKAITDKEQMKEWYFDVSDFKAEIGFKFQFEGCDHDNVKYIHLCEVTEVVLQQKLSHTWIYAGYQGHSVVTWELFEEGDKTRVKLTHTGLETFPNLPSFARESFAAGWTEIVGTSLSDHVETSFINKSADITATAETVWHVLTNRKYSDIWGNAFSEGTYVESDWQVGGSVIWKSKDGDVMINGTVEKSDTNHLLKVSYPDADAEAKGMALYTESYVLSDAGGKTRLSIASGPLVRKHVKMHEPLWDDALQRIKELAEKQP